MAELPEGIILHVTADDGIAGIEILDAKWRLPVAGLAKPGRLADA